MTNTGMYQMTSAAVPAHLVHSGICHQSADALNIVRLRTPVRSLFSLPSAEGIFPPIQRCAAEGDFTLRVSVHNGRLRRPGDAVPTAEECRALPAETRGDRAPMVPFPLLTPQTLLCAATPFGRAAKWELRGLGSVRQTGYGMLYCPEFSLRKPPRITVRGHPVQSA